jgi:AraC-like DNA-binding protein
MYSTGQRKHAPYLHSFRAENAEFTGEICSQHGGLELVFSLDREHAESAGIDFRKKAYSFSHPSAVLAYNPAEEHRELFRRRGQTLQAIVFSAEALKSTLGEGFDDASYAFGKAQSTDPAFGKCVQSLYKVLRNNELDAGTMAGLSEGLITEVFSRFGNDKSYRGENPRMARRLATYLARNFRRQSCWLGAAEEEFSVTKFHLIRAFKAEYRKTPHQFLTELRVQHAAELLRERKEKILEIAFQSGFEDLSAFNKCFKRRFGRSPRNFALLA